MPTICEKGRHQNCVHTKAQAGKNAGKPARPGSR